MRGGLSEMILRRQVAVIALACCMARVAHAQSAPASSSTVDQHIRNVEAGLVGSVVIKGDAHAKHSLSDRMNELHVPGVSIAVLHNGKIEWARGFGVSSVGGPPVNT